MKATKLPRIDSIEQLARFWDTHDATDFQDELEEVPDPVFADDRTIRLRLPPGQAKAVRQIAQSKGISQAELVHQWVLQKLGRQKRPGQART